METQVLTSKGELLIETQGRAVTRTIQDFTPHGVKLQINNEGQVSGKYNAGYLATLTMFLKTDGSVEWENKAIHITQDGDFILLTGRGTGRVLGPTERAYQGDVTFMTQSPRLAWLNNTKGLLEGSGDIAAGTYQGKVYAKK